MCEMVRHTEYFANILYCRGNSTCLQEFFYLAPLMDSSWNGIVWAGKPDDMKSFYSMIVKIFSVGSTSVRLKKYTCR
jgi:hypothetical protein